MNCVTRVSVALVSAAICLPCALAENQDGLVKENPGQLGVYVVSDANCPFEQQDLLAVATSRMTAQQLEPKDFQAGELYLRIIVSCLKTENGGGFIYNDQVDFVVAQEAGVMRPWQGIYGAFGIGQAQRILQIVEQSIDSALADYVDSNPDLQAVPR
jgi:hypothetical protein